MDDEGADQLLRWGQRLDAWLIEALLRSANEDGEIGLFRQIRRPSPPLESASAADSATTTTTTTSPASSPPPAPASKRGCLMTLAVLVLLAVVLTIQAWSRSS
jgi:hypothetical protein